MSAAGIAEKNVSVLRSLGQKIGFIVLALMAIGFIFAMNRYALDAPMAPDDMRMYVTHFMDRYLSAESISEKIGYFFSQTNYPHAKFSGRTVAAIYYELFGKVNFKFLIIFGSLVSAAFVFCAKYITKLDFVLVIPIALLLLLPDRINFWVGPITGYPFLLLYALLVFYGLSKGRFIAPAIIAFIASFTHTPGMAIFVAAAPMFFIAPNKMLWKRLLWPAVFLLTVFIYWKLILSNGSVVRDEEQRGLLAIAKCLPSMIVYEGQFLAQPFFGAGEIGKYVRSVPVMGAVISLSVLLGLALCLFARRKSFDAKSALMLCFVFFCLIPGPIAAFSNDKCASFTDLVAPRYMMYSVMAWVGIYLFVITSVGKKYRIWMALIFMATFLPRYVYAYQSIEEKNENRQYLWAKRATLNSPYANKRPEGFRPYRRAIDKGIYIPNLPKFEQSASALPESEEVLEEFWYDYRTNNYYCKFEAIIDHKSDAIVEIWIEKDGELERRVPMQTSARAAKAGFKVHLENPKLVPLFGRTKGYFYSASAAECGEIRFRLGDQVSETLSPKFIKSR